MSNFADLAFNPKTKRIEDAYWIDNHFGRHRYGIRFNSGEIEQPDDCGLLAISKEMDALRARAADLSKEVLALREALNCFLDDERFQVAVAGNPIAVDRMITQAQAALASTSDIAAAIVARIRGEERERIAAMADDHVLIDSSAIRSLPPSPPALNAEPGGDNANG